MKRLVATLALGLTISQLATAMQPPYSGTKDMSSIRPVMPAILPVDTRCTLSLGSGVIDYGSQSRWQLQNASTAFNSLTFGKRTLPLGVVCPYTQHMRLTLRGERGPNGNLLFGKRGNLTIRIFDAQMDGSSVRLAQTSSDGILSAAITDSLTLQPGQSFAPITNGNLAQGKVFTANLEIEPVLPEAEARVSAHQTSQATITLELMN